MGRIVDASAQGKGWLTPASLVWNDGEHPKTRGPSICKIPGSRDAPPELNVHILEDAPNMVPGIFRSKAIGEPPPMPAIPVRPAMEDVKSRAAKAAAS